MRRVVQDPSQLKHYKPQLGGGALVLLLLFILLRPSSDTIRSSINWDGQAAENWGE